MYKQSLPINLQSFRTYFCIFIFYLRTYFCIFFCKAYFAKYAIHHYIHMYISSKQVKCIFTAYFRIFKFYLRTYFCIFYFNAIFSIVPLCSLQLHISFKHLKYVFIAYFRIFRLYLRIYFCIFYCKAIFFKIYNPSSHISFKRFKVYFYSIIQNI